MYLRKLVALGLTNMTLTAQVILTPENYETTMALYKTIMYVI